MRKFLESINPQDEITLYFSEESWFRGVYGPNISGKVLETYVSAENFMIRLTDSNLLMIKLYELDCKDVLIIINKSTEIHQCSCGAAHTTNPNYHYTWCAKFGGNK